METKDGGTTVMVYINKVGSDSSTCFQIDSTQTCRVDELKAASIEVNDYYDTGED